MFGGGEDDAPPDAGLQTALALETAKTTPDGAGNITAKLIATLPRLFFETRKDAAAVFNALMRHPVNAHGDLPHVRHLNENPGPLLTILTASEMTSSDGNGGGAWGRLVQRAGRPHAACAAPARRGAAGHVAADSTRRRQRARRQAAARWQAATRRRRQRVAARLRKP